MSETALVSFMAAFVALGGASFVSIQCYMNSSRRKQWREDWFAAFEAQRDARYALDNEHPEDGMAWRCRDLHEHWGPGKSTGW